MKTTKALLALVFLAAAPAAQAGETLVAVAANFTAAASEIGERFQAETGHSAKFSFGATGQFYTQITQGAPFEVFLAADDERPSLAEAEGYGVPGSVFTYAIGKLVLWSADPSLIDGEGKVLERDDIARVAIANPVTAPYGAAAVEAMKNMGLYEKLDSRIVQGSNITQAHQFIATGNAPVGFVALAQIALEDKGSKWLVPEDLYTPIRQDAVLLKKGEDNKAARAFLDFLKSPAALEIIRKYGYGTE
ncbi:molybdate ABC transporter substrate-binding protein [Telmatospirillum sp. J64-1]|uniref:molybdate ABC transporter substrate-binding protein n=1 Tax=Telmatospirillum sp. J64-1 TaxID=2502183 RepID=UPI00115EB991|nr:molybdate ABC transporter substrate-binding protein [Telmatospirillum sp. J64-1]